MSTRSAPLKIYQDPVFDSAPMLMAKSASGLKRLSPLRPLKNAATRRNNIVFNPPQAGARKQSPFKTIQQSSSSPSRAPLGNKLNMIPMPPPGAPLCNTDSMEKKPPTMSNFKTVSNTGPQKALFTTFASSNTAEKENEPQAYYSDHAVPFSDGISGANFSLEGLYPPRAPAKRLLDAAPIHETRPSKKVKAEQAKQEHGSETNLLPSPDSFPALHDDGTKPSHSYAQLIGMSILRAPNRRLTLAQIYKWISDSYSFYNAADAGWQNSIRHNLSLNKAFIKQERPKDDPGKGNYWAIQPGMEQQFIKEKKKGASANENGPVIAALPTPVIQPELPQALVPHPATFKPLVPAPRSQELPMKRNYSSSEPQRSVANEELSSDATIPASDALIELEKDDLPQNVPPSSPLIQSSPPAAMMHSSPPVPRHVPGRQDTPPPVPRFPSSSRSRSRKRKFASMDDSGYISSLDSSAMRPHRLLTSEADRPRIKRGRAEEEIARLRGSSYDSPTKSRISFAPPSSSPLRQSIKKPSSQMLPPLTPVVKLKAPVRPPPSVSPNTNLRMHRDKVREMVGSPLRGVTALDDNLPWSPAFNLDDNYMFSEFATGSDFDIFTDTSGFLCVPGMGSPEKKSAKRPRLDRSKSANILADVSNTSNSNFTSTPSLKLTSSLASSIFSKSPAKGLGFMESPSKLFSIGDSSPFKLNINSPSFDLQAFDLPHDDFLGAEFLSEELDDFSGVDIMQGFQKIGAGGASSSKNTPKVKNNSNASRPGLGRSFTSRF